MATANAATTCLENRILSLIFKNNAASFSTPGNDIFVGLATNVTNFDNSTGDIFRINANNLTIELK